MNKEIVFDFELAYLMKNDMEQIVAQMNHVVADFEENMFDLSQIWKGETTDMFLQRAAVEKEEIQTTVQSLSEAEFQLSYAIKVAEMTEMKVKELAEIRTY